LFVAFHRLAIQLSTNISVSSAEVSISVVQFLITLAATTRQTFRWKLNSLHCQNSKSTVHTVSTVAKCQYVCAMTVHVLMRLYRHVDTCV